MDQHTPDQSHIAQPTPGHISLELPPVTSHHERKSLAIAIVVAAIFLLAALGVAAWLFMQKQTSPTPAAQALDPNDTSKVTKVGWVVPKAFPASYQAFDHSMSDTQAMYYVDTLAGCSFNTRVIPAGGDLKKAIIVAHDAETITTASSKNGTNVTIADVDAGRRYDFKGVVSDQSVAAPGIDFDKQTTTIYYKQFGEQVASVAYTCKQAVYAAKDKELAAIAKQFKVKTER